MRVEDMALLYLRGPILPHHLLRLRETINTGKVETPIDTYTEE